MFAKSGNKGKLDFFLNKTVLIPKLYKNSSCEGFELF